MKFLITLISLSALCLSCSKSGEDLSGTAVETTNGISGTIHLPNGEPAQNHQVTLRPINYQHENSSLSKLGINSIHESISSQPVDSLPNSTTTDETGKFLLQDVDFGNYLLEVIGDSFGLIQSLEIDQKEEMNLGNLSEKRLGTLSGTLDSSVIDNIQKVYLLGLERTITLDGNGNFKVEQLPPYDYKLLLQTTDTTKSIILPIFQNEETILQNIGSNIIKTKFSDSYKGDSLSIHYYLLQQFSDSIFASLPNFESMVDTTSKGRINTLYLNGTSVSQLDSAIFSLDILNELHLDSTGIKSLPDNIHELKTVWHLSLAYNNLTQLPVSLIQWTSISNLNLSGNKNFVWSELNNLSQLSSLKIRYMDLTTVPTEIKGLSNLSQIDLNGNQLTQLDATDFPTSTVGLDLMQNSITSISTNIEQLTKLEWLYLNNNQLTSLPTEIGNITTLQSLKFTNNQINDIPQSIVGTNFTYLFVGGNLLCNLSIDKVTYLNQKAESGWDTTQNCTP